MMFWHAKFYSKKGGAAYEVRRGQRAEELVCERRNKNE